MSAMDKTQLYILDAQYEIYKRCDSWLRNKNQKRSDMKPMTFVEKVLGAPEGAVVFRKPDLILTHDNTSSIFQTFRKMGGEKVSDPGQMVVVLDHNAPPADAKLATQYQDIRDIVAAQGIKSYDSGMGICQPDDVKTCSSGHDPLCWFGQPYMHCRSFPMRWQPGIDRTEAAGIWKRGETWFLVPSLNED